MGYFDTNKILGIAISSFVVLLAIWKFSFMGGEWFDTTKKVVTSVCMVGIITFLIWRRE